MSKSLRRLRTKCACSCQRERPLCVLHPKGSEVFHGCRARKQPETTFDCNGMRKAAPVGPSVWWRKAAPTKKCLLLLTFAHVFLLIDRGDSGQAEQHSGGKPNTVPGRT